MGSYPRSRTGTLNAVSSSLATLAMSHTVSATEHLIPELAFSVTVVRKDDTAASEVPGVARPSYHEPVVTRRELWSYYRTCPLDVILDAMALRLLFSVLQRR